MGVPQNGGFIEENPIKMDDWEVPYFREPSYIGNNHPNLGTQFFQRG